MFTKEIVRWILGGFSKETTRWIIGGSLLIPTVIVPIIVVIILFVGLRNVTTLRKTNIINLIVASGVTLLVVPVIIFHRKFFWIAWAIESLFAICWLACAIGLFYRKRLAWCGSVLGAGALVYVLAVCLATAIAAILYPGADTLNSGSFLVGYIFSSIGILTWICLALTISLRLLFGLLRIRRDIFSGGATMPHTAPEPTVTASPVLTKT